MNAPIEARQPVLELQEALQTAGFSPGAIDGELGIGTEAAIRAFQRSHGLVPDGRAGPLTRAALGLGDSRVASRPDASQAFTLQVVARMVPGAPLANIARHLPLIIKAMRGMTDRAMLLMALATVRAETAGFEPITEGVSRYNTSPRGRPFDLYDNRRDLGNRGAGDGVLFPGRGFVQLTGRRNYETYGKRAGVDLIQAPELANDPTIAANLLALFLRDHEHDIRLALYEEDFRHARRLVNGGAHGLEFFVEAFKVGAALTAWVSA